jgi:hypothetical protein
VKLNFQAQQLSFDLTGTAAPSDHLADPDEMRGRARRDDPRTSKAGAAVAALTAGSQKGILLAVYAQYPEGLNDEEAAERAGVNMRSCWWKRSNELRQLHYIEPLTDARGELVTRLSSANVPRMVCAITQLGREVLDAARV